MSASLSEQFAEVLANDPSFPPDRVGDPAERVAALDAFEAETGFTLPADVRHVMVEIPTLRVLPRLFDSHVYSTQSISIDAYVFSADFLARYYDEFTALYLANAHTDTQAEWMKHLVPVLPSGEENFSLDFLYDAKNPPLIGVDLERSEVGRFIAPSLLDFLRNELAPADSDRMRSNGALTEAASAWSAWFDQNVLNPTA